MTTSRNWSVAHSWATGTNWSEATAAQRVYEFTVEPPVLQNLPDHALLLTVPGRIGPDLRAVECNPAIVTLPGVSTRPLTAVHVPAQLGSARPAPDALAGQQSPLTELTGTWSSRKPWEDHRPRHSRYLAAPPDSCASALCMSTASWPAVSARIQIVGASGPGGIEPAGRTAVHSRAPSK